MRSDKRYNVIRQVGGGAGLDESKCEFGAVPYMENVSSISLSQVESILNQSVKNPRADKISTAPPTKPIAGELYVYSGTTTMKAATKIGAVMAIGG